MDVPGTTSRGLQTPSFVGRDRELARVVRVLSNSVALVLIEGEAGIGKSRLVREVLATPGVPSRGRVAEAICPPYREPQTLGPIVDAIRQVAANVSNLHLSPLAGALRPLFIEWADQLPPAPEEMDDPTAARHRVFRALSELLAALGITTLVMEDVHWADDATMEFLLFLVASRPPHVSLVVTYRPEDLPVGSLLLVLTSRLPTDFDHARVSLRPLAMQETVELVSSMLHGDPLSNAFAAFLQDGTDGVPLAVEESIRLMIDRSDLVLRHDGWERRHLDAIDLPPTVRDAVLERVQRLPSSSEEILQAVSVLGEPTEPEVVMAVSELSPDEALSALSVAVASGLVLEDLEGRVAFHHALSAKAVYDEIEPRLRRELHGRAGRALEASGVSSKARLSRHFRLAGVKSAWSNYAEQAIDQALATGDDGLAAATAYDLVVDSALSPSDLLRLIHKIPSVGLLGNSQLERLAQILRTAKDDPEATPAAAAQCQVQLGRCLIDLQQYELARMELEQAVELPGLEPGDRARAMNLLGWPLEPTRQPATVQRDWLQRSGEALAIGKTPGVFAQHIDRATGLLLLGEGEGWEVVAALDAQLPEMRTTARVIFDLNIGEMAMLWGRLDEARVRLTRAYAVANEQQYRTYRDMLLVNLVRLDWVTGKWPGLYMRAAELADDPNLALGTRVEARLVAYAMSGVMSGDDTPAALHEVLAATRQFDPLALLNAASVLGRRLLHDGDVGGTLAVTDEPIDMLVGKGVWIWATDLGWPRVAALIAADRIDEAKVLVDMFSEGLCGRVAAAPQAGLMMCRAFLAHATESPLRAAKKFRAAAESWTRLPRPYDAFLAQEHCAKCLIHAGRHDDGFALLSRVSVGFAELGASRDADRARHYLRDRSGRGWPNSRRGRPSYGSELSPSERRVVDLVVQGQTNKQVADALQLSVHTVNNHVRSAMRKLQVSKRATLALAVSRLSEDPPEQS